VVLGIAEARQANLSSVTITWTAELEAELEAATVAELDSLLQLEPINQQPSRELFLKDGD